MLKRNSQKRFKAFRAVAFASAMAVVCNGCRNSSPQAGHSAEEQIETPEAHNYVQEKMAATGITVPQNLRGNTMAAQTYVYMARSAAAVSLCTDSRNFETGSASEQAQAVQRGNDGLGEEIIEYITELQTDNVDPAAVKAMTILSDNYDAMNGYNERIQDVKIDAGTKWAGVLFGIMSGVNSADDVDFNKMTEQVKSKFGTDDLVTVKSVTDGYSKMQRLAHQTDDGLAATQRELSVKYHSDFPRIPLNTNYASRCDLPWYF